MMEGVTLACGRHCLLHIGLLKAVKLALREGGCAVFLQKYFA